MILTDRSLVPAPSSPSISSPVGQKIVRNLRASVFSSILRQEVAFFDRTRTGELINRLSADTAVVGRSLTDNLSDGLRAVAQAVAGVSMMVRPKPFDVFERVRRLLTPPPLLDHSSTSPPLWRASSS